ncbi:MAG: F0F1 ATP synthase subunit delta [Planctomycetota bacterium]
MDAHAKAALTDALRSAPEAALLRSAFELPDAQKDQIRSAVKEALQVDVEVRFEIAPALVSGVELSASGQKVAWSIAEYLRSLSESVRALIDGGSSRARPAHAAAKATEAAAPHGA